MDFSLLSRFLSRRSVPPPPSFSLLPLLRLRSRSPSLLSSGDGANTIPAAFARRSVWRASARPRRLASLEGIVLGIMARSIHPRSIVSDLSIRRERSEGFRRARPSPLVADALRTVRVPRRFARVLAAILVSFSFGSLPASDEAVRSSIDFNRDIRPILSGACYE